MMASSKTEIDNNMNSDPDFDETADEIANSIELSNDPDYLILNELYQDAEFAKCIEILEQLEKRYPDNPGLLNFKDDLEMKLSLKTIAVSIEEGEKHKKKKIFLNMSAFAIISTLVVVVAFILSYFFLSNNFSVRQLEIENTQLTSLYNQAEQLLLAGQPQPAAEIVERIRSVNPKFENLADLSSRTDDLLRLEANYLNALNLVKLNQNEEALDILNEIEAERPGLWGVSQQIASIETTFQIAKFIEEGNAAYEIGNWDQVINAYENALKIDSTINDPIMNEQLLRGYLNKVISMLDKENNSIEDIEKAEEYYRKAVSMTPQSRAFASERGNLQKVISDLLEQKFFQIALASLEDKNQTGTSISKAVTYIRKAANINPENTYLQSDLKNAEYYQIAFNNLVEMNWGQAIINLEMITSVDKNFANGNASLLLFEAYYALGKQYHSLGLYLDAFKTLEQAEILAWDDSGNLMKLFQVQVFLGDTSGKIGDYENAVSYYQFALNAIQAPRRLTNYPAIATKQSEANVLAAYGKYEEAFTVFQEVLKDIDVIYSISEIEIGDGVSLVFFANENLSTVDAIINANNLPKNMITTFGRKLKVPMIEK